MPAINSKRPIKSLKKLHIYTVDGSEIPKKRSISSINREICSQKVGHDTSNPNNALLRGKSRKFTIQWHQVCSPRNGGPI